MRASDNLRLLSLPELLGRIDSRADSEDVQKEWEEARRRIHEIATIYGGRHGQFDDVDDVTQDVVLRLTAPAMRGHLATRKSPSGYLATMVINGFKMLHRRRLAASKYEGLIRDEIEDRARSPVDTVLAVTEVLDRLTPDERTLVDEFIWLDLPIGEIARRHGVSYATIAQRLPRLFKRLRKELSSTVEPDSDSGDE